MNLDRYSEQGVKSQTTDGTPVIVNEHSKVSYQIYFHIYIFNQISLRIYLIFFSLFEKNEQRVFACSCSRHKSTVHHICRQLGTCITPAHLTNIKQVTLVTQLLFMFVFMVYLSGSDLHSDPSLSNAAALLSFFTVRLHAWRLFCITSLFSKIFVIHF